LLAVSGTDDDEINPQRLVEHRVQGGGVSAFASDESDFFQGLAQKFSHMWLSIDDTDPRRHLSPTERWQLQDFFWSLFGHGTPCDLTRRYDSFLRSSEK
jgi:hypothetical protein